MASGCISSGWPRPGDGLDTCPAGLRNGHFRWPQPGEEDTMVFSSEELHILLGGARVEQKLKRMEVVERKIV
ncbi:transposase [Christensenellaceae bacterium OttesenSCG-928-M15]|nr:transposase [Christensenellaceae bacterium OttesenSCG-928-M15]